MAQSAWTGASKLFNRDIDIKRLNLHKIGTLKHFHPGDSGPRFLWEPSNHFSAFIFGQHSLLNSSGLLVVRQT